MNVVMVNVTSDWLDFSDFSRVFPDTPQGQERAVARARQYGFVGDLSTPLVFGKSYVYDTDHDGCRVEVVVMHVEEEHESPSTVNLLCCFRWPGKNHAEGDEHECRLPLGHLGDHVCGIVTDTGECRGSSV